MLWYTFARSVQYQTFANVDVVAINAKEVWWVGFMHTIGLMRRESAPFTDKLLDGTTNTCFRLAA